MRIGVHDLSVEVQGDGEPVVFVHSSGLSGRQWRRWLPAFAGYRTIVPDLHGCGRNPPWEGPWPFPLSLDLDFVLALLEAHGPAHLVGHSYGGALALYAAIVRRDLVRSVCVYEPPLMGLLADGTDADRDLLATALPPLLADPAAAGTTEWMETFVDWWNGPGAFRALAEPARNELLRTGRKVSGEVMDLSRDRRPWASYAAIDRPLLVLSGDRPPVPIARVLERLAELPRAERVSVEGGHMLPLVSPDRLIPLVLAFIRASSASARPPAP